MSKAKTRILIFVLILGLVVGSVFLFYSSQKHKDFIYKGIKISGIDVSRLNKKDAGQKVLNTKLDELKDAKFDFDIQGEEYSISYSDMGYQLDIDKAVDKAFSYGKSDSEIKNFFEIIRAACFGKNIALYEDFEEHKLDEALNKLILKAYIEPRDARVEYTAENGFKLYHSANGQYVDSKELKELIKNNIDKKELIEVPIIVSYPKIDDSQFDGIDSLLGEFSTDYSKSVANRKDNIALASSKFNDLLIKPGEEISFNNTVGDISAKNGFKTAAVIVNGEFNQGLGGGVCQVSTTLYNSLILADLEISERHNHSRPISYVDLGTDAAVAEGYKDLKFKNNTNHNIYLKSEADGSKLKFQVFGNKSDRDYEVKIIPKLVNSVGPKTVTKYSNKIKEGQSKVEKSGSKGYVYTTYKEISKNGEVLKTEQISTSNYAAQDRVVIIGTGSSSDNDKKSDKKNDKKSDQKSDKKSSKKR